MSSASRPAQVFQHDLPFDPTYGYDREALLRIAPPPEVADFADFWRATAAAARRVPLNLETRVLPSEDPERELLELRYDVLGGHRVGAWLWRPRGRPARIGVVAGHGYGGRGAPGPGEAPEGAAWLFTCAPGFSLSARRELPDTAARHVIHGIATRETYLIRACVAALWAGASALLELHPEVAPNLVYHGGSFGGGLGALALPWDERFVRAQLEVPTFGHHPLRLRCPCVGSGEAVRSYHARHPEVESVLAYYDAAVAAKHVAIPVLVAPALFDPAVPPPGQFAVANALPRGRLRILPAGHHQYPGVEAVSRAVWEETWAFLQGEAGA